MLGPPLFPQLSRKTVFCRVLRPIISVSQDVCLPYERHKFYHMQLFFCFSFSESFPQRRSSSICPAFFSETLSETHPWLFPLATYLPQANISMVFECLLFSDTERFRSGDKCECRYLGKRLRAEWDRINGDYARSVRVMFLYPFEILLARSSGYYISKQPSSRIAVQFQHAHPLDTSNKHGRDIE